MKAARIDEENEGTAQSLLTLPAACLEPPGGCEQMWTNEWETEGWRFGRKRVKTYDTWGEGERVSHWKMQRGGEGTGEERKDQMQ